MYLHIILFPNIGISQVADTHTITSPFHFVNNMDADGLATPGARASAALILTEFAWNN